MSRARKLKLESSPSMQIHAMYWRCSFVLSIYFYSEFPKPCSTALWGGDLPSIHIANNLASDFLRVSFPQNHIESLFCAENPFRSQDHCRVKHLSTVPLWESDLRNRLVLAHEITSLSWCSLLKPSKKRSWGRWMNMKNSICWLSLQTFLNLSLSEPSAFSCLQTCLPQGCMLWIAWNLRCLCFHRPHHLSRSSPDGGSTAAGIGSCFTGLLLTDNIRQNPKTT